MSRAGLIRMKGFAVTFTQTEKSRNRLTGVSSAPTKSTVKGYVLRAAGDAETYKALELIEQEAITLDFVPKVAGEVPAKDARFEFDSKTFTVRSVELMPHTIGGARIIGSR